MAFCKALCTHIGVKDSVPHATAHVDVRTLVGCSLVEFEFHVTVAAAKTKIRVYSTIFRRNFWVLHDHSFDACPMTSVRGLAGRKLTHRCRAIGVVTGGRARVVPGIRSDLPQETGQSEGNENRGDDPLHFSLSIRYTIVADCRARRVSLYLHEL